MKSFVFPTGQRNNPLGFFAGPQNDARLTRGFRTGTFFSDWCLPSKNNNAQPKS